MASCIDLTQSFAGLTHHKPFILTEENSPSGLVAVEVRSGPHHLVGKEVHSLEHRLQLELPEYP